MNKEKKQRILNALTTAMEKPEIANALIQRVINGLNEADSEWVGLTDEEMEAAISDSFSFGLADGNVSDKTVVQYAKTIEAKLKEKNNG